MKNNKRILFLLGAGAANHWFDESKEISAKTDDITRKMVNDICFCKVLYKHLKQEKLSVVNFETLVNAIENMFLHYYGSFQYIDYDHSILFNSAEWVAEHFETDNNEAIKDELFKIYKKCIEIIIDKVYRYDCCIKENHNGKNESLIKFLEYTQGKDNILRGYTLNYDQMFIDTCSVSNLKFIDGFKKPDLLVNPKSIGSEDFYERFDIAQIINDLDSHCFYNLHGSIYWHWYHFSPESFEKSQFMKSDEPFGEYVDWQRIGPDNLKETNPGERILKVPIITGFKKLQRINIEPFNAISNTFYRDSLLADVFVFIGYSFNDPHINNVLSNSHMAEKNVIVVDYNPMKKIDNYGFQPIIGNDFGDVIKNGVNKMGNIRYFSEGITDFLEHEQYKIAESFF